jgi:FdhD protein
MPSGIPLCVLPRTRAAFVIRVGGHYGGGMVRSRSEKVLARRVTAGVSADGGRRPDDVIVEEPLEVRLDGELVATTMRTPGHDFELAVGLCFTDGLLAGAPVASCRYCGTGSAVDTEFNVVSVDTGGRAPKPIARLSTTSSACGICGTMQIDELTSRLSPLPNYEPWDTDVLLEATTRVPEHQELFARTGSVHAAASFDRSGAIGVVREDIGRHNAVDKVIGRLFLDDLLPATGHALFVSGRASFEMVQKAWAAGFEAVIAVSAPSSLAIRTAEQAGLTLAGFVRDNSCNVYASPHS